MLKRMKEMGIPGKQSTSASARISCEPPGGLAESEHGQRTRDQPRELTKARGVFLSPMSIKAADTRKEQLKLLQE